MNEKEAKVPENMNEWEGIDIYLFSNGQQFSPPRKYHLTIQELNSWGPLLSYLARAQYGYMYSTIDLYSIEGEKISGPLELSHGLSYVTVEPNDTFIDAGYGQYLMKSSRSWLKRYGLGDTMKSDDMTELTRLSGVSTNIDTLNEQNTTATTKTKTNQPNYKTNNKEQENTKINLKPAPKANGQMRSNVTAIKTVEKRKQSVIHRNSVSNKTILSTAQPQKKEYLRKDSAIKDNLKVVPAMNKKASIKPAKFNKLQVNKMNTASKTLIQPKDLPPAFVVPLKLDGFAKQKDFTLSKIPEPNHKEIIDNVSEVKVNQNKENNNLFKDTDTVSKLHGPGTNTNILVFSSSTHEAAMQGGSLNPVYLSTDDAYTIDTLNIKSLNSEIQLPIINTKENSSSPPKLSTKNKNTSHSDSKVQVVSKITSKTAENLCARLTSNSVIASDDQKNTVKLKICIEVKNDPNTVSVYNGDNRYIEDSKLYNDNTRNTLHEKESQVNFDEMPMQNIPLHTLINELNRTDQKVVLIYYNSYNNDEYSVNTPKLHIEPAIVKNNEKETEVVVNLSRLQHEVNVHGCSCEESTLKVDKWVQTSSTIVETGPEHGSYAMPEKRLSKVTTHNVENSFVKHKGPYEDVRAHPDIEEETILKKDTGNIEFLRIEKDHLKFSSKVLLNKYTQTDTHNLLLEARHHEDSHYSFHLPPLGVLKRYNLQ